MASWERWPRREQSGSKQGGSVGEGCSGQMKLQRAAKIMNSSRKVPGMMCGCRVSLEEGVAGKVGAI